MTFSNIFDENPFLYNLDENNITINNLLISESKTLPEEDDIKRKLPDNSYKLIGYLSFSEFAYGRSLRIEFIYGFNQEIISILLDRFTIFSITNKYQDIEAGIKLKYLDSFLRSGYVRRRIIFNNTTGNLIGVLVVKKLDMDV